jgi:hypothetical protein
MAEIGTISKLQCPQTMAIPVPGKERISFQICSAIMGHNTRPTGRPPSLAVKKVAKDCVRPSGASRTYASNKLDRVWLSRCNHVMKIGKSTEYREEACAGNMRGARTSGSLI